MTMRPLTILITGVGAPGAYGVIRSLRTNGERQIRIVGVDLDPYLACRQMIDRFHQVPPRTTPAFAERVLELVGTERVDVVLPVPTEELELFATLRGEIEALGARVMVSDLPGLQVANHKPSLYRKIAEIGGVPIPDHRLVQSVDQLVAAVRALGHPDRAVCVRRPEGAGARGFRVIDESADHGRIFAEEMPDSTIVSLDGLLRVLQRMEPFVPLIVQEHLPGDEFDADVLAMKGNPLCVIPRRNDRMLWGMSLVATTEDNETIRELASRVVRGLGLSYVVSVTFKLSQDGRAKLLEVNPRIPGSIVITTGAGVNLPYLALKLALGEPFTIPPVTWGLTMIRYWDEVFVSPDGQAVELGSFIPEPPEGARGPELPGGPPLGQGTDLNAE